MTKSQITKNECVFVSVFTVIFNCRDKVLGPRNANYGHFHVTYVYLKIVIEVEGKKTSLWPERTNRHRRPLLRSEDGSLARPVLV
jgi:hypothetical protein